MREEICEECGRIIGIAEQAYIYKGRIVCEQCDRKLREEVRQDQQLQDTWKPEEFTGLEEAETLDALKENEEVRESEELLDSLKTPEPEEFTGFPQAEELEEPKEAENVREEEELLDSLKTPEPEEFTGFPQAEELEEPKEAEDVREETEIFESLEREEREDFSAFQEFEEPREPKEPQKPWERKKLSRILASREPEEFEEYEKPDKLRELIEPPAGPFVAEQAASVRLPHKRRRIRRTRSTLLCFLLTAWTFVCLLLLFYVPGRYADLLKNSAFGKRFQLGGFAPDCLILSMMVLWFVGALILFVVTTALHKDKK